jgi:hypothetical protein
LPVFLKAQTIDPRTPRGGFRRRDSERTGSDGGGTIADFLVVLLKGSTGYYIVGFTVLGMLVVAGGI